MFFTIFSTFFIAIFKEKQEQSGVQEKWEKNIKLIAKSYLKGFFIFDLLACVPSLYTLNTDKTAFTFKYLKFLYVPRILFQISFLKNYIIKHNFANHICIVNTFHAVSLIFRQILIIHFVACIWIKIGIDYEDSWMHNNADIFP